MDKLTLIAELERLLVALRSDGTGAPTPGAGATLDQSLSPYGPADQDAWAQARLVLGWQGNPAHLYTLTPPDGRPWADRLVSVGTLSKTSYRYDPSLPAWKNAQAWDMAGRPERDADGNRLDVRGEPLGRSNWNG